MKRGLPGGDPSLVIYPPTEQFRQNYVFLTPDKYAFDFVVIVAPPVANVTLDGLLPSALGCTTAPADGLTDAQEVKVTKTNPNSTDTDNGFSDDGVEVLIDHTDPTKPEDDKQDSDKDGLPDWIEVTKWGSDRFKADSDGDGLPDGLEDANANGVWDKTAGETSPVLADSDADGLKDGVEDKNLDGKVQKLDGETDPNNPDSDFDGLKDGDEVVKFGTDPLLADTDWDSLGDFEEVVKFKTNPLKIDSDGGGVLDPVEVTDTTNPNAAARKQTMGSSFNPARRMWPL